MNKFKSALLATFSLIGLIMSSQEVIKESLIVPPQNVGGKPQLDHIVKTQLIIPDKLLKAEDKDVNIFFTVTKEGKVINPFFKERYGELYEKEALRLLKYFLFEPAKQSNVAVEAFGSLTFNFSATKYKSWVKERNKYKINLDKAQDTSFVVHEMADKSAEFYKGDDALAEFILSNIEYPNVAKTQNIEGTVNLSFIVEANGHTSNVKVLKGVGGGCSEEAVRVVNLLRWKPAEKNGKFVRYKMNYPITFNLKIVNKDATQ
jgi:TonB family protein